MEGAVLRWWHHAWPGLLATLNGVGLCRFAYTPLIPFMIAAGSVSDTEAGYLGAANLAGYLAGAALAAPLARGVGLASALRGSFALSALALGTCIWPGCFWWYAPWRFLAGASGAVLMVLAPGFLLMQMDPSERGRTGGVIYIGVGIGIALSSVIVPPLASFDIAWAWAALALGAALTALATWPRWHGRRLSRTSLRPPARLSLSAMLTVVAFGMDGIGFIPHMLFWVDYVARDLALGTTMGAVQWLCFGLGAALGPPLGGRLGDVIGLGRALIFAFAMKALAVLIPAFFSSLPLLTLSSLLAGAFTPGIAALSAARLTELVPANDQIRAWGFATLVFALLQAASAYTMTYAYGATHNYPALYVAGSIFEYMGAVICLIALFLSPSRRKIA
jgi:MFS family permease